MKKKGFIHFIKSYLSVTLCQKRGINPGINHNAVKKFRGFTLIEIMIVVLILGILAGLGIPGYVGHSKKAREAKAIIDIKNISMSIEMYKGANERLPNSLADAGCDHFVDPWGNPYQYLNFDTVKGNGKMRKDRFLVPINSEYDLYSMGEDGTSQMPLTAKASQDDIIFANDGGYIGPAYAY